MNAIIPFAVNGNQVNGVASGLVSAVGNPDGTITLTYKDGTVIVTQPIKGEKGDKGDSFEYSDFTEEELAALKGEDGKTVQVLAAGESESDIKDETVLAFELSETISEEESYTKVESDVRYAKRLDVGDVSKLSVATWKDLVTAINDVYGKGMGGYRFEVDENRKALTIVCRNGVEVPIDISQIILNTNITEFKDMLVTSILDGQSLVWNASKKKWVNKSIDSSGVLVEAKQYTDDEIKKINNKGQMAVDEKPTYYGGVITYRKGGETKTTDNTGTWFYYLDESNKAVQTIFIEGTEFTIAMAGDINLDDYIAQTEKADTYDDSFTDKTKVPTTRYIEELKSAIDDEIADKVNITDIEDNLTSDATDKPLSAKQGKELDLAKLNKKTDATNRGKALVVDENGNIVFGDVGVKVSSEEGNKITEKDDGIFVASEIDDESTDEDKVWSAKKVNDSLVDKVPFKFGITDDGQYGYIKDGADTVTPFKSGSAEYVDSYIYKTDAVPLDKGEYILTAIAYAGGGVSTARKYIAVKTFEGGTDTIIDSKNGTGGSGNNYALDVHRITIETSGSITFATMANVSIIKIG